MRQTAEVTMIVLPPTTSYHCCILRLSGILRYAGKMAKELPIEPEIEKIRGDMRTASTSGSQRVKRPQHGPMIRDTIIGFADGLTVPFALTAGLSSFVFHSD